MWNLIRSTARFGEKYALATEDTAIFDHALSSNAVRIRLYISTYRTYQKHLDNILEALHKSVDRLQRTVVYDHICLIQALWGVSFLSAIVLIAVMGDFGLFSFPKKLHAYFDMEPV